MLFISAYTTYLEIRIYLYGIDIAGRIDSKTVGTPQCGLVAAISHGYVIENTRCD